MAGVDSLMPAPEQWPSLVPARDTITWQRASDARMFVAAGYALLLQVAHPTVGAGVSEHSQFRRDPWGRLLRTLDYTYTMVYGGPRAAGEMGRRIRAFHRLITGVMPDGRRYSALEPGAYAWVHATLAAAIVDAHERFGRPFSAHERQELWTQWRALGRLLGIRERDLPDEWEAFRAYFRHTVANTLVHTAAVDEVLAALAKPSPPAVPPLPSALWAPVQIPLGRLIALTSIGLLGEQLRGRFGLRWSTRQERQLRVVAALLRAGTPLMPSWLRSAGPGYLRQRAGAIARREVAAPGRLARDGRGVPDD
jgi:uncharacterized protein (DUF2236 family)